MFQEFLQKGNRGAKPFLEQKQEIHNVHLSIFFLDSSLTSGESNRLFQIQDAKCLNDQAFTQAT